MTSGAARAAAEKLQASAHHQGRLLKVRVYLPRRFTNIHDFF
jgi:hypothetical protein